MNGTEQDVNSAHSSNGLIHTQPNALSDVENAMNITLVGNRTHAEKEEDDSSESESDDNSDSDEENGNGNDNISKGNNKKTQNVKRSLKVPPVDIWTDSRAEMQKEIQKSLK